MKNQILILLFGIAIITLPACKEKKGEKQKGAFIPVLSIIKGQVNHIDTSLYSIIKVTYRDSMPADTEYIRREDIRLVAKDFLELPELSKKKYIEENIPGPTDNLSTFTYRPIHPEKEDIQRVDLVIDPGLAETGQNVIKSIFIERGFSNRDSSIQKKMLWRIDKSFQVTTISQKEGREETTHTFKVVWNEDEN
jgi:hypothetical protein